MKIIEIKDLLIELKTQIGDEYRVSDDPEEIEPGMPVTIACNEIDGNWTYQTGDNSFMGGCYHYQHWAVIYLYRNSNCLELARDAKEELLEYIASDFVCS